MWFEESANYAANKVLQKLGIEDKTVDAVMLEESEYPFTWDKDNEYSIAQIGDMYLSEKLANAMVANPNFTVHFDGVAYPCTYYPSGPTFIVGPQDEESNVPFLAVVGDRVAFIAYDAAEKHTVGITYTTTTTTPIKKEYIPWDDMPEIGPGVVDLTKYTMGDTFTSVDGAILGLFSAGGGIHSGADNNGFWDAVNTDKPITFIIDASPMGVVVTANATCYVKNTEGDPVSIEASFLVDVDGWKKVTVVFGCVDGITITVFVEPLTISGA